MQGRCLLHLNSIACRYAIRGSPSGMLTCLYCARALHACWTAPKQNNERVPLLVEMLLAAAGAGAGAAAETGLAIEFPAPAPAVTVRTGAASQTEAQFYLKGAPFPPGCCKTMYAACPIITTNSHFTSVSLQRQLQQVAVRPFNVLLALNLACKLLPDCLPGRQVMCGM